MKRFVRIGAALDSAARPARPLEATGEIGRIWPAQERHSDLEGRPRFGKFEHHRPDTVAMQAVVVERTGVNRRLVKGVVDA
jgi:hypothetical protein